MSSSTIYQPLDKPISEKMLNLNLDPYEIYLGIGWYYRYIEKFLIFLNKEKLLKQKLLGLVQFMVKRLCKYKKQG